MKFKSFLLAGAVMAAQADGAQAGGLFSGNPFKKGGWLSIDKPFDKGGTLSINRPFNSEQIANWGKDINRFAIEHPWETVAAIALVAGGTYLIVYQGYALQIGLGEKAFTVISATEVGAASVGAGSGTLAYTALKSNEPAKNSSRPDASGGKSIVELPAPLPQLPKGASDSQKLEYAYRVLSWSHRHQPLNTFDTTLYKGHLSPAEMALAQAALAVQSVKPSSSEVKSQKQTEGRLKKAVATALAAVVQGAPSWSAIITALAPTTLSDGVSSARAVLTEQLQDRLGDYAIRRQFGEPAKLEIKPVPEGPTIGPKP